MNNFIKSKTNKDDVTYEVYETDKNNSTMSRAQEIEDDQDVLGEVNEKYDIDFYKIKWPHLGTANFYLNPIGDHDVDLRVYDESGKLLDSSSKMTEYDLVTLDVEADTYYYIRVRHPGPNIKPGENVEYHLRCKNYWESDLGIISITADKSEPFKIGEEVKFSIKVKNYLSTQSPKFAVRTYGADDGILKHYKNPLDGYETTYTKSYVIMNSPGKHTLTFKIEQDWVDQKPYNNTKSKTFTWTNGGQPPIDHVWYSQISPKISKTWVNTNLDKVYFTNCKNSKNELIHVGQKLEWYEDDKEKRGIINREGCVMCSIAMLLKNLNKKTVTKHKDIRTGLTNYLNADPFTVTMSNIDWIDIPEPDTNNQNKRIVTELVSDPIYLASNTNIEKHFGITLEKQSIEEKTNQKKAEILMSILDKHPEGVRAHFSTGHSIVITKYKDKGDRKYDTYFTVCDPGTTQSQKGNNVNFASSYGYNSSYYKCRISSLKYIQYIK